MICCSVQHKSAREIQVLLEMVEMAEIRLDRCVLADEEIDDIFCSDTPLVATCRIADLSCAEAERRLMLAIRAGAHYVDLEIEAPHSTSRRIADACAEYGTTLIRSYHNLESTPSQDELRAIVDRCRHYGGQIVKVVTRSRCDADAAAVASLYKYYTADSLIAFCIGDTLPGGTVGGFSFGRLDCLAAGAPFSYASPDDGEPTAPGQLPYSEMYKAVYGEFGHLRPDNSLRMPSSKSYAQRAIIAAALSDGTSILRGYTSCGDSEAALQLAATLGAVVKRRQEEDAETLEITGIAASDGKLSAGRQGNVPALNVRESGLLARLMIPLVCQMREGETLIECEGVLAQRQLPGLRNAVEAMGGRITFQSAASVGIETGKASMHPRQQGDETTLPEDNLLPALVSGPLRAGRIDIDGSTTSQIISGALMALPLNGRNSTVHVINPTSIPYIYITMDILRKFGIKIRSEMYGGKNLLDEDWSRCTEIVLKIREKQKYKAASFKLEGDWSAAAAFLAAGAIFGEVRLDGLDTASLQADLSIMDLLMDAGASLSQTDGPEGTITAHKAPLRAVNADLNNSPDLFPVASVLCAFCQGRSILKGVHRLRHKESDRAAAILEMMRSFGVPARIKGDNLQIDGESLASRIMNARMLKGGDFASYGDHRMVFALRLAELGADSPLRIDNPACVSKSYPAFNDVWKKLNGNEYIRK